MAVPRREFLILGGAALAAAATGALFGPLALQSQSGAAALLSASFPDLSGTPRKVMQWRGQVLVANFWATWCEPCREEVPLLGTMHERFGPAGATVLGIGIDSAEKLKRFAAEYRVAYPILVADVRGIELMRRLGNGAGALPFTVVLDRQGALAHRKLGALRKDELEAILLRFVG